MCEWDTRGLQQRLCESLRAAPLRIPAGSAVANPCAQRLCTSLRAAPLHIPARSAFLLRLHWNGVLVHKRLV
eukprot:364599-Chlamydomonas_euryale.AAC.1